MHKWKIYLPKILGPEDQLPKEVGKIEEGVLASFDIALCKAR
jgi:hypothetical protein